MSARYAPDPALARARSLAVAFAAIAVLAAPPQIARAAQASGERSASAAIDFVIRIPVVLKVRAVRQPARLDVSAEDALRGYVDVGGAIALEIVSNSRHGFGLRLQATHPVARAVSFLAVASPLHAVDREGGLSVTRVAGDPIVTTLTAGARIMLAPGTAPGTYPWPVAVAVHVS
jgi:hypothetical protein